MRRARDTGRMPDKSLQELIFQDSVMGRTVFPRGLERPITLSWKINSCSDLSGMRPVSRARLMGSTQLVAVSRHEEGPGETSPGPSMGSTVVRSYPTA